jgi:2,4-dienoyl-CoA reductase-like NADH-dependent reductase (Old Yellow Enzyme family)
MLKSRSVSPGSSMTATLTDPLRLPCGAVLPNRLAKPAITEGLATARGWATPALERLYEGWARGGFGLLISGNIIVDADHLERPGNVIMDQTPTGEEGVRLRKWTAVARRQGAHFWAQLSHSGRQTPKAVNPHPLSPSAVELGLPPGLFGKPRAMSADEIAEVVGQFATAARVARSVGFTGVQIHAAHGYLISSFLSPKVNQRTDEWGGSLENRARLLMSIVAAVRKAVGPGFPIGVKLNSADFQKGGFGANESEEVALKLQATGVDLLEISGGSYEAPAMIGDRGGGPGAEAAPKKASTIAREAYFLDFARTLRQHLRMPIMLTGGLRTRAGMQAALDEGVDVIGVARPVCIDLTSAARLLAGEIDALEMWEEKLRKERGLFGANSPLALIRTLVSFAGIHWFYAQIYRHGRGEPPHLRLSPLKALIEVKRVEGKIEAEQSKLKKAAARAERPAVGRVVKAPAV